VSGYRVWCLSWDDEEDSGKDYLDKPDGKGREWALDSADAARLYADYCHSNRDGWESTWPLNFRVRLPDNTTKDFEVEREMVPEFVARTVKP
jgi:hypothetical protein